MNSLTQEGITKTPRPRCLFCNKNGDRLYSNLQDHLFGVSGLWNIDRCTNCELLWLNPYPTNESLEKLYRTYYTHEGSTNEFLLKSTFKDFPRNKKIKYAILATHFGYDIAIPASYHFIGFLAGIIPSLRKKVLLGVGSFLPKKSARLLDVGCGNGDYLLEMKYLGWDVFGVEIDTKAATIAQKFGLDVIASEFKNSLYPENYFSAIYMNNVIEHLSNPKEVMAICYKMLKPGGLLTIKTCSNTSLAHMFYKQDYRGLEIPRHFFIYSPKSLNILGQNCGFITKTIQTSLNEYIWISSYKIKNRLKDSAFIQENKLIMYTLRFLSLIVLTISPQNGDDISITFRKP